MINDANALNEQSPNVRVSHSTFPMERHIFGTYRFGEYSPFFYYDGIPSDTVRQRSITTTRSMSLSAPLMQDIKLKRDYFIVPYQALLPRNWEKVYVNPKKGDDVIADKVGPFVENFPSKIADATLALFGEVHDEVNSINSQSESFDPASVNVALLNFFRWLVWSEMFYSNGCLLATLGVHLSDSFKLTSTPNLGRPSSYSIDRFIDKVCSDLLDLVPSSIGTDPSPVFHYLLSEDSGLFAVSSASDMRLFLQHMREGDVSEIRIASNSLITNILGYLQVFFVDETLSLSILAEDDGTHVDLARCAAYQICCAHYYTNDNIDYIYSAELWREYIGSLLKNGVIDTLFSFDDLVFIYNGVSYQYDWLCALFFDYCIPNVASYYTVVYPYFYALFGFKRSLRFVDYFAGARKEPLAVGDPNVAVNDNLVSVVDINRMTQFQRLWNNVLRLPSQIEGYVKGLFPGSSPKYDYHNPAWLAHTSDVVFTAEVENTGDSQTSVPNSITATFRGNSSDKEFTIDVDFPGIIIGIQYFDIRRAYFTGIDRLVQHEDRFDMALPELQYIGDQEIRGSELLSYLGKTPISYTGRNMEYKQVIDQAFGGFVESLPGWSFLFDPKDWYINSGVDPDLYARISPNFIRSLPIELDQYFIKLSNFSLGTYFHFQQKIVNITEAKRPLVKDPQILG